MQICTILLTVFMLGLSAHARVPTKRCGDNVDACSKQALALYLNGKHDRAIRLFRKLIPYLDPGVAHYYIGRCHEEKGDYERANKVYQIVLAEKSTPAEKRSFAEKHLILTEKHIAERRKETRCKSIFRSYKEKKVGSTSCVRACAGVSKHIGLYEECNNAAKREAQSSVESLPGSQNSFLSSVFPGHNTAWLFVGTAAVLAVSGSALLYGSEQDRSDASNLERLYAGAIDEADAVALRKSHDAKVSRANSKLALGIVGLSSAAVFSGLAVLQFNNHTTAAFIPTPTGGMFTWTHPW